MSSSVTIQGCTGILHLPQRFPLHHGAALETGQLAFEAYGPIDAPAILALGGISAHRHVSSHAGDPRPGWWDGVLGAVDTRCFRVFGIDYLGGPDASTGPRPGDAFPSIDARDQARAIGLLAEELGIGSWHAVLGSSYGGMVALALAEELPERVQRTLCIGAAHESDPMTTAWRSLQRRLVRLGIGQGQGLEALAVARGIAMATYRSAAEFRQRFAGAPERGADGAWRFPVEGYLEHHGETFRERFTPEAFLCLSESIDLHRAQPEQLRGQSLDVVAVDGDQVVPPVQVEELAERSGATLHRIESMFGHDAFLKEVRAVAEIVHTVLDREVQR